eukprot:TRINITY_DN873_c0_g1_i8.p1 TRINITY_DN873_c0_g1~~TRINITY_DN873_c0_g1_i8.p1  ORF type:complete len:2601 (+),score=459.84 TRINITY_DN873_c0_g1_i8:925-8727(+)
MNVLVNILIMQQMINRNAQNIVKIMLLTNFNQRVEIFALLHVILKSIKCLVIKKYVWENAKMMLLQKNYFQDSDYYQCVEKCPTTDYKFQDSKTDLTKSYCKNECPGEYPYYAADDKQECLEYCKDHATNKFQPASGTICIAACVNHGYALSPNPSDQKICLTTECYGHQVLTNQFKLSEDSSDQYQCVQYCPSVAYQYQDSYSYTHSQCVNECPPELTYFMNDATQECRKRCPDNFQYYVKVDGSKECLSKCPDDKPKVDNQTELDKSYKCVEQCPTNLYEDPLTFKGTTFCVLSCKALTPIAYIDKDKKTCTRECKTDGYIYIDFSDEMNPKCSAACSDPLKYIDAITNKNENRCVSSCKNLIPSAFITKAGNSCTRTCVGNEVISSSIDNPQCKDTCDGGEYIDALTNPSSPRCVSSCKLLVPSALINLDGKACTLRCKSTEVIDGITDEDKPQCKANCKGLGTDNSIEGYIAIQQYYDKDEAVEADRVKDYKICVKSCQSLNPPAYIYGSIEGEKICKVQCPAAAPYIDDIDGVKPKCVDLCSTHETNKYIDELSYKDIDGNIKVCVKSCKALNPPAYIDETEANKFKCTNSCPETKALISSDYKCVAECAGSEYVHIISGVGFCVSSCKDLVPTAYIYESKAFKPGEVTTYTINECVTSCSGAYPIHDSLTDPQKPKCVDTCNTIGFIDDLTYNGKQVCTKSCKDLVPVAFVDNVTDSTKFKCYRNCPLGRPYIKYIALADDNNLLESVCVDKCETQYIDELTIEGQAICVKSCRALIPEAYLDTDTNKCVRSCPNTKPYLWTDADKQLTCSATCHDAYNYIDDGLTTAGIKMCVPLCKDLIPSAFIYEDGLKCVRNCSNTDKPYIFNAKADNLNKPTCKATCEEGQYIDMASVDKKTPYYIYCVKSCKALTPTAYVYTDTDDGNKKKCYRECPSSVPYVDYTAENDPACAANCPTIVEATPNAGYYYIDNITTSGVSMCVKSCKQLNPPAYIYLDPDNGDKETCVRVCPVDKPYVNIEDEDNPKCDTKCYSKDDKSIEHYIDDELTTPGLKICVKSCEELKPTAYIYTDPDINKQKCVRICPYKALYVDPTDKHYPKCTADCPDGEYKYIDNELTTSGLKICVKSCKNLEPTSYIYKDPDNGDRDTCIRSCPDEVPYVTYDLDNPKCADKCYDSTNADATKYYIDDLTTPGQKFCVPSCKTLNPIAYIYVDPDLSSKERCVRKCPEDKPYVDESDLDNPKCVATCPDGQYLDDEVTTPGLKICVKSCKNLNPTAYIYNDPDLSAANKNRCVRACPEEKPYVDQTTTDSPECKADCPSSNLKYLDNGVTTPGLKICVNSCKNLGTIAYLYTDPDNKNMETCVRTCPDSAKYVNYEHKDIPTCTASCSADFYIDELTTPGLKMCVRSCKELIPTAYVYEDADLTCTNKNRCVRTCPINFPYVDFSDINKPKCEASCLSAKYKYIDEISTVGVKICVKNCLNLKHLAYIYIDTDDGNKEKCVYECPSKAKYVIESNTTFPKCATQCNSNYYIDDLTTAGLSLCVPSCKNLVPTAYVYTDPEISKDKCVRKCPDIKKYVDTTTIDKPTCKSECDSSQQYFDENTIDGVTLCVSSCKHIRPLAYLVEATKQCVVDCSKTSYPYFDALTNPDKPVCALSCGENYYYTNIMSEKHCMKTCASTNTLIYGKACVEKCPTGYYIDNNSTNFYFMNATCVNACPETPAKYYINSLTNSENSYCVNSCKNLDPTAYIDPSVEKKEKCTWTCPAEYPYIDESTKIDYPTCVSVCPDDHPYIFDTENRGRKVCVASCFGTLTKTLIDKLTYYAKPDCVAICRKETAPYLDRISDPINPICLDKCPLKTAKFLDAVTDSNVPVCLSACDKTAPYDDLVTIPETPKCLKKCLPGTYLNGTHCLACQSPCAECVGNATNCTACKENYYLLNNSCPDTCPDGMQRDKNKWICDYCYKTCKTCTGSESTDCISCNVNYIFTTKNKCENQDSFIEDEYNLESEEIDTFEQLEIKTEQINNIGNLDDDTPYSTIQNYMISTMNNSVDYLTDYVETQNNFSDTNNQAKLSKNLEKLTNVSVELPIDSISAIVSTIITKINVNQCNKTIAKSLFKTTNNVLKFMKKGAKSYKKASSSYETSEEKVFDQINKLGNIGLQLISKHHNKRRMLESLDQLFVEYDEYSMLLESQSTGAEKWTAEVKNAIEVDNFFFYEINSEIDYTDLRKIAINYPKSFVKEIINKIPEKDVDEVLIKTISYNFIRTSSNKYKDALQDNQQIYGSVVTFSFQYQQPETYALTQIDANKLESYITIKVPINYKLNGDEDLECMAYNEDDELWKDDDIVTAEKTDTYVICKTRKLNAITIIAKEKMVFKKNYALYFSCFQIPFAAIVFILVFALKNEKSMCQKYLSFSPFFSALTASTSAHAAAKCLLFSFQLAVIEFVIAIFFNFNRILNEGEIKDAIICIAIALAINWVAKYIFGVILNLIYKSPASCLLYTMFMAIIYTGLCVATCYFVYYPENDNFYNIGLYATLIAFGFDFIAFDLFFVLILSIIKLPNESLKGLAFGGYISIYHPSEIKQVYDSCDQEEIQPIQAK